MDQTQPPLRGPPSWVSIVKKEKRFSIDVIEINHFNHHHGVSVKPQSASDTKSIPTSNPGPPPALFINNESKNNSNNNHNVSVTRYREVSPKLPKKCKRLRVLTPNSNPNQHPTEAFSFEMDKCSSHSNSNVILLGISSSQESSSSGNTSCGSSPSPGLTSSCSSATEDFQEELTASAASMSMSPVMISAGGFPPRRRSSSPMQIQLDDMDYPGVQDLSIRKNNNKQEPKLFNNNNNNTTEDLHYYQNLFNSKSHDQPQDLSMKNPRNLLHFSKRKQNLQTKSETQSHYSSQIPSYHQEQNQKNTPIFQQQIEYLQVQAPGPGDDYRKYEEPAVLRYKRVQELSVIKSNRSPVIRKIGPKKTSNKNITTIILNSEDEDVADGAKFQTEITEKIHENNNKLIIGESDANLSVSVESVESFEEEHEGDLVIVEDCSKTVVEIIQSDSVIQTVDTGPVHVSGLELDDKIVSGSGGNPQPEQVEATTNEAPKANKVTLRQSVDGTVITEGKRRRGRKRKDEEAVIQQLNCFLCNFTCIRDSILNNHMTRMHTVKGNRGNVKCTVCGFGTSSVDELRSHQELIHGGQDPEVNPFNTKVAFHACNHCSKKFRSQSQLEAHLRLIAQKNTWKEQKGRRNT